MKKGQKITLAIAFSGLLIFLLYILNKIIFLLSTMKELLYSENSNYYNWRFGKVFYTKKGNGSPILLLHDIECTSSDYEWHEIVQNLSETHTVYTLDLLGCGRSDKPKITYTSYLYVQLISDFIKNVIKHKTDVISSGRSSSSVIMACYIDTKLFGNLIMINPNKLSGMNKIPKYKHKLLKYLIDCPIIGTLIYNIAVSKPMLQELFADKYYYNIQKIRKRYINAFYESAHTGGSSCKYLYSSIKCHFIDTNIVHAVKEINNSIYILCGEYSPIKDEVFDDYTKLNPAIETYTINNSKLMPQLENPTEILKALDLFI